MSDVLNRYVYEDRYFQVVAPDFSLNCREDGGHLVVVKKEPVTDRSDLTYQEAVAFMRIFVALSPLFAAGYDMRSTIVHGRWKNDPRLEDVMYDTEAIWRTGLRLLMDRPDVLAKFVGADRNQYLRQLRAQRLAAGWLP